MKNKILFRILCSFLFIVSYLAPAKRGRSQLRIPRKTTSQRQTTNTSKTLDYGLFEAVVSGDLEKVEEILTQHQDDLNEKAINKTFIKTMTGRSENLKPKIALLFLKFPKIKKNFLDKLWTKPL